MKVRPLQNPPARITALFATAIPGNEYFGGGSETTLQSGSVDGGAISSEVVGWSGIQKSMRPFGATIVFGPTPGIVKTLPGNPQNVVSLSQSTYSPVKRSIAPHMPLSMSGAASTEPEPGPHPSPPAIARKSTILALVMRSCLDRRTKWIQVRSPRG